jgi:phosphotriesterase-related protein
MMATVQSATGPLDTADLGLTLMHEHVILRSPGMEEQWPRLYPRAEWLARAVDRLVEAKAAGVRTMVDLTTVDLGRDTAFVAEAAQRSGMQVIVATGVWWRPPPWVESHSPDQLAELFIGDITEGCQGTGVRAGIIKCATDTAGVTPAIETVLRASARAHRATGVPISTHTYAAGKMGLEQQRIFREEGLDLSRVVIGHSGDSEDFEYLQTLTGAGSMIGMDRFGISRVLPTDQRVAVIAELCRRGEANTMVLSHDAHCVSDWLDPDALRQRAPDWRFTHIPLDVVPALRAAAVTDAQIDQMLIGNPRALFERQETY